MTIVLNREDLYSKEILEAWKNHGNVRNPSTEFGFFNPDLTAYPAMDEKDEILKQAKHYDCLLKIESGERLLRALDEVLGLVKK